MTGWKEGKFRQRALRGSQPLLAFLKFLLAQSCFEKPRTAHLLNNSLGNLASADHFQKEREGEEERGAVAVQLVECLPGISKALGSVPSMAYTAKWRMPGK